MKSPKILPMMAAAILVPFLSALPASEEEPFPRATPESQELDSSALDELVRIVRGFVDEGEIAGAELLMIKNRKTVLHEAIGWKDAEDKIPMVRGTIFNIRSMSKPVTGTMAQMLIDEGKLALSDPVSDHLDFFGSGKATAIEVGHLLTHRSGFPMSCINVPLTEYADLAAVARQAAGVGPEFTPDSRFRYSDAGSDCLGAVVEAVGGSPLSELFESRIFAPLRMTDTYTKVKADDPRVDRTSSNHTGTKGTWLRYWKPGDEPFYPFAMGSQSVYCTPVDYARFLALWMDEGMAGGKRLLSGKAIERGLEPVSLMNYPTRYEGLDVYYARMWMLYIDPEVKPDEQLEAFGHGGSDGTYAVAFPGRDLMVLFFTQSRGMTVLPTFERAVDALVLNPDPKKAAAITARIPPDELRPYLGLYRAEGQQLYRAIVIQNGKLAAEIPGSQVLALESTKEKDCWQLELQPEQKLRFERSGDGKITGLQTSGPVVNEKLVRFEPAADLPSMDELMKKHLAAHGTEKLDDLGAFRLSGKFNIEARKLEGRLDDLYRGRWCRKMVTTFEGLGEQRLAIQGEKVWNASLMQKPQQLSGILAEQARLGSLGSLIGDWRDDYREVRILYRLDLFDRETYVVRTVPHVGPASTKYIDTETGLLLGEDRITLLPGVGMMGALVVYKDYRDVEGVKIPFLWESKFEHPLIGTVSLQYEKAETNLDLPEGAFALEEKK